MISSIYFPPPKAPAHSTCVQQSRTSRRTALVLYVVEIFIVFIIVLSCFFSPPQILLLTSRQASALLIAGTVRETETSLDDSAPAVIYRGFSADQAGSSSG